jgi:hypothetical protein
MVRQGRVRVAKLDQGARLCANYLILPEVENSFNNATIMTKYMTIPKKYLHDHLVLLLLSVNAFLAVLSSLLILVRLGTGHGNGYIVQFRSSGINNFKPGSIVGLLSFIVFAWMVMVSHTMLSLRAYHIHRQLAIAILSLGLLLLVLTIIVSNALLALR